MNRLYPFSYGLSLLCAVTLFLSACGNKDETPPPPPAAEKVAPPPLKAIASANPGPGEVALPPKETLFAQWMEEATKPDTAPDPQKLTVLAGLVGQYEDGYDMFFDLLANPDTEPRLKLICTISMTTYVFPEDVPRLIALTQADQDATTRACAAQLLSSIPPPVPEATARLKELCSDENLQVRVAAVLALATHGDAEAQALLPELWKAEGLNAHQRSSILFSLADTSESRKEMYMDAVRMHDLSKELRLSLVEELSMIGGDDAISVLLEVGENDPEEEVRLMAKGAAAALSAPVGSGPIIIPRSPGN